MAGEPRPCCRLARVGCSQGTARQLLTAGLRFTTLVQALLVGRQADSLRTWACCLLRQAGCPPCSPALAGRLPSLPGDAGAARLQRGGGAGCAVCPGAAAGRHAGRRRHLRLHLTLPGLPGPCSQSRPAHMAPRLAAGPSGYCPALGGPWQAAHLDAVQLHQRSARPTAARVAPPPAHVL